MSQDGVSDLGISDTGMSAFSDVDDFEDHSVDGDHMSRGGSIDDGDFGDAALGMPFRVVPAARVESGVGLTGPVGLDHHEVPVDIPLRDFEFTNFRDAQSRLRTMLNPLARRPAVPNERVEYTTATTI